MGMKGATQHHAVLGVAVGASENEVRQAFR